MALTEAEKRLRALVGAARGGARFAITEDFVPQARLLPPARGEDARRLDFLSLRRHLSRCEGHARPRTWTRAALYRSGGR
jgi:antitoxin (DNA-binding transcriptional repressor) of toxin-antitoxin stability system